MVRSRFPVRTSPFLGSLAATLVGAALLAAPAAAQERAPSAPEPAVDPALYGDMEYRMIGPYRGGRSTAVAGVAGRPELFYMGTAGGGVWRTDDAGHTWENLSDGFFGGDVGSVRVAGSDPSVIYVGTGSACIRGNVSTGRGMWQSEDGGESWSFVGLREAGQIGALRVHPRDPETVYAAALGHPFGKNPERGVYRTTDGGDSWEKVLFVSDSVGAVDLAMHPQEPNVLYAAMWRAERDPWKVISGARWSAGAGLWKTADGGGTWEHLEGGLPAGDDLVGRIGVAVSPADPDRVWALVEAEGERGGLYRSDDAGESWTRVNGHHKLRRRPFYYTHVFAHPTDPGTVFVLSGSFHKSTDGGENFDVTLNPPHWDQHDLWINPERPEVMIVGNDGGGQVTLNGGRTWSTYFNQPTAQFYRVHVDEGFPYRVYGAQQDNGTITVPGGAPPGNLPATSPKQYWYSLAAGEAGHIATDPRDPALSYAGDHGGRIDRADQDAQRAQNVHAYPEAHIGVSAENLEYRFQWNAPVEIDPFDPDLVYHASQVVHVSRDGGRSWEEISPDLTHDDPEKQGDPGGPITRDATGVEVYNTVFALAPSPHAEGVLWAGTDDGRVWLTRTRGGGAEAWTEVTPPGLPQWSTVNAIEVSPHEAGTAYVAAYRYRLDDFRPYVFRTEDYGASWTRIADGTTGIPADHPTRVVREDPDREGLLYAGTEFGMYVSFDDGARWQSLQLNLPTVPVTDLAVHRQDLVVATQGRSFWILDNLTPLHQLSPRTKERAVHLFRPRPAHRVWAAGGMRGSEAPESPPPGAAVDYWLGEAPAGAVRLEIRDPAGEQPLRRFTSDTAAAEEAGGGDVLSDEPLPAAPGMHRFTWDLRTSGVDATEDAAIWGPLHGVRVPPGEYEVRLVVSGDTLAAPLEVAMDPRLEGKVSPSDLREQHRLALAVRDTMSTAFDALRRLREARLELAPGEEQRAAGLTEVERALLQTRNEVEGDAIANPPRLMGQYARLYGYVAGSPQYSFVTGLDAAPTRGAYRRFEDLNARWSELRERLEGLLER